MLSLEQLWVPLFLLDISRATFPNSTQYTNIPGNNDFDPSTSHCSDAQISVPAPVDLLQPRATQRSTSSPYRSHSFATPSLRPQPQISYFGHNEAWRESWKRGKSEWDKLSWAQHHPRNLPWDEYSGWGHASYNHGFHPLDRFCHESGLLRRFSKECLHHSNLCESDWIRAQDIVSEAETSSEESSGDGSTEASSFAPIYEFDMSTEFLFLVNNLFPEGPIQVERDDVSYTTDIWPQIASSIWFGAVEGTSKVQELQYIMFGPLVEDDAIEVMDDIWRYNPNWTPAFISAGTTPIAQYTPQDDNFYALLGTSMGVAAARLLQFESETFATRDHTETLKKVKSISSISVAGSNDPSADQEIIFDKPTFDMILTLEDIDPP